MDISTYYSSSVKTSSVIKFYKNNGFEICSDENMYNDHVQNGILENVNNIVIITRRKDSIELSTNIKDLDIPNNFTIIDKPICNSKEKEITRRVADNIESADIDNPNLLNALKEQGYDPMEETVEVKNIIIMKQQ